jgi:hypothetical protein
MKQVVHAYLKGPGYLGTYREEDPLHQLPSVYCSIALLNVRHKHITNPDFIDNIGISGIGLDVIADPNLTASKHAATQSPDILVFPPVEFQFGANNIDKTQPSSGEASMLLATSRLHNSAALMTDKSKKAAHAVLSFPLHLSPYCESVTSCMAALGGPSLLFPFIHACCDEDHLVSALRLLSTCTRNDAANLKFMQVKGYKILSFILSRKDQSLLTYGVFESLLNLSVYRFTEDADGFQCVVLYDVIAFYHLVMNHQVRS